MIQGSQTTFICGACINESSSIVVLTKLEEIQIRQSSIVRQGIGYLQTTCPLEKRQITLFGQKWREIFFSNFVAFSQYRIDLQLFHKGFGPIMCFLLSSRMCVSRTVKVKIVLMQHCTGFPLFEFRVLRISNDSNFINRLS